MSTPLVPAAPGARPVAHRRVGSGRGGVPRALGALLRPAPPTPPPPAPQQLRRSALSARNRPPGQAITPGSTRSFFQNLDLLMFFPSSVALWPRKGARVYSLRVNKKAFSITGESGVVLYCFLHIILALCDEGK